MQVKYSHPLAINIFLIYCFKVHHFTSCKCCSVFEMISAWEEIWLNLYSIIHVKTSYVYITATFFSSFVSFLEKMLNSVLLFFAIRVFACLCICVFVYLCSAVESAPFLPVSGQSGLTEEVCNCWYDLRYSTHRNYTAYFMNVHCTLYKESHNMSQNRFADGDHCSKVVH